jgi:hypothetical protein
VEDLEPGKPIDVELDGQRLTAIAWPMDRKVIHVERRGAQWSVADEVNPTHKTPPRCGPFKNAFGNNVIFVYGTKGTAEENAWAYNKARFDGEAFYYRGNGSVDVVADASFDPRKEPDRNVILYGNAETNAAWSALLGDSPVQVSRDVLKLGERELKGPDLGCIFIRPRPGSDISSVAVVSGTGVHGCRLTDRLPYFLSGAGYPDCLVIGSTTDASKAIRCAGFFGNDWSIQAGEFLFE